MGRRRRNMAMMPLLLFIVSTMIVHAVDERSSRSVYLRHVERLDDSRLFHRGDIYVKLKNIHDASPHRECKDDLYLIYSCNPPKYIFSIVCVIALVILAGAMAGLTVGILSLNKLHLSVLVREGKSSSQRAAAARLLPLLSQHRVLLVTLVLMNALANEALPIFLNTLINPVASVVFSVTIVVLFGEIVPTALCTGEQQILIGASCVPLLEMLMRLTYPIAYPIAVLLKLTVGEPPEMQRYSRNELKVLLSLQDLPTEDLSLLHGILHAGEYAVQDVMARVETIDDDDDDDEFHKIIAVPDAKDAWTVPTSDFGLPSLYWHVSTRTLSTKTTHAPSAAVHRATTTTTTNTMPGTSTISSRDAFEAVSSFVQIEASAGVTRLFMEMLRRAATIAVVVNDTTNKVVGMVTWRMLLEKTEMKRFENDTNELREDAGDDAEDESTKLSSSSSSSSTDLTSSLNPDTRTHKSPFRDGFFRHIDRYRPFS
jgi:CBS domain containing-hemolysin-like protein